MVYEKMSYKCVKAAKQFKLAVNSQLIHRLCAYIKQDVITFFTLSQSEPWKKLRLIAFPIMLRGCPAGSSMAYGLET